MSRSQYSQISHSPPSDAQGLLRRGTSLKSRQYPPVNLQHRPEAAPLVGNHDTDWNHGRTASTDEYNVRILQGARSVHYISNIHEQPYEASELLMSEVNRFVLQFTHPSWFSNEVIIAPKVNFTTCSGVMMSEPSLVTNPHRGAPSPAIYLGTTNRTHLDNADPSMLQNYAMDLILAFAWAILVAGLVVLLEFTAKHASKVEKQPWYYDWLPTIALTVFTQVHGPITAAFDARIAVSTLKTAYAPKTWAELFYTADHKWSSPLGMLTSLWSTSFRVSLVFYLFMLHTILAISAPLLLSRSYPFQTIPISQSTNLALTTFYPPSI